MIDKLPTEFLEPILDTLPIEMSFIDKEDTVRYYSKGGKRIFPRSPEVIGRKVQQCHPPKSLEKVQAILDGFRNGTMEKAEFWIELNGKKVLIRYFPVHDKENNYLGCLEVSQDITEIQKLEGEKRLL